MIPGLAKALFAVLDGFRGTAADTGHAVGAVTAPDRLAILDRDVVPWAEPGTLTAAGAGIAGRKSSCFEEKRIENRVYRAAHEAVVEVAAGRRERLLRRDDGNHTVNVRFRPCNDLPRFLRVRRVEHGNVIFRHDDLRRTHIDKAHCKMKMSI